MLYLLGGVAVLSGFPLLIYLFVNAHPARLPRLLEAYLDRAHPEWREELAGEHTGRSRGSSARPASGDMSVEEAYAILGLSPGADPDAIKEAHRRLMVKLHPDHGGSDYLATKIN